MIIEDLTTVIRQAWKWLDRYIIQNQQKIYHTVLRTLQPLKNTPTTLVSRTSMEGITTIQSTNTEE